MQTRLSITYERRRANTLNKMLIIMVMPRTNEIHLNEKLDARKLSVFLYTHDAKFANHIKECIYY